MAEKEQNRTEQATPYKLSDAKKRGQVAKSLDFNTVVMILGLLAVTVMAGGPSWLALRTLCHDLLANSASLQIDAATLPSILSEIGSRILDVLTPFLLAGVIAAIVANLIQTGPILSGDPIKPKFERINPVEGLKRVFSTRMLFEALKSVIKLMFFGSIVYVFFTASLPGMLAVGEYSSEGQAAWLAGSALALLFRLGLGLVLVGLLDFAYVRWKYSRQMMMSRREMKEEVKRREGDPQIRAKIRQLQRENLKQARSLGKMPDADVLITNPNHFAVALRYDRNSMNAPMVLAKGSDNWAQEMKSIARQHGIPIFERKRLARMLFRSGIVDQQVPHEAFVDVARIYADLGEIRRRESRYEVSHP
jgi:flagellar biosynthesis protein FlhB